MMKGSKHSDLAKYDEEIFRLWDKDSTTSKVNIAREILGPKADNADVEHLRKYVSRIINDSYSDKEIIAENVRLAKQKQRSMDQNRIQNKSFREHARVENAIEALAKEIRNQNSEFGKELKKIKLKNHKYKTGGTGVIHLTDLHFNEEISLPHNKFNFEIAAKRLKKHVTESLAYFKFKGISKVLIAFTGDLMNSDRRLDEIINQTTNRAKATILAVHILKQLILEVRQSFPVTIISVLGNESRAGKEMPFSNEGLSDNYDFTIIGSLHQIFGFSGIKDVKFLNYQNVEEVVQIEKQKWLLCHNLSKQVDSQKDAQSTLGRYSLQGHKIDMIIGGHIHQTNVGTVSARSGSLPGSNSFNENALGLAGRSQQNCFVVNGNDRTVIVNDLQDTDGIEGYEIISGLEAYNTKSASKLTQPKTILQIVI